MDEFDFLIENHEVQCTLRDSGIDVCSSFTKLIDDQIETVLDRRKYLLLSWKWTMWSDIFCVAVNFSTLGYLEKEGVKYGVM